MTKKRSGQPDIIRPHERLRAWHESKGETLQTLADVLGMTRQGASLILLGERGLNLEQLELLCSRYFNISPMQFFGAMPERAA